MTFLASSSRSYHPPGNQLCGLRNSLVIRYLSVKRGAWRFPSAETGRARLDILDENV